MKVIKFDCFQANWQCVSLDPATQIAQTIVNDCQKLQAFYKANQRDLFVGYNIRNRDQWLFKAALAGKDPCLVMDALARGERPYFPEFNKFPLYFYDVMTTPDSLDTLKAYMGLNIDDCTNDVYQILWIFQQRISEFQSCFDICKEFNLGLGALAKTQTQLAAMALGAVKHKPEGDEFAFKAPASLSLKDNSDIVEWFYTHKDYKASITRAIGGIEHVFGWGGLHGAVNGYHERGRFINVDVSSYYPSLMLQYGYISRAISTPQIYGDIYNRRLAYKAANDPRQRPFKLVLNKTYGGTKDKTSALYDPLQANNICVTGQLLLLDLLEHVLAMGCAQIVQTNTDGVLFKLNDQRGAYYALMAACLEWEQRTKMKLEFDEYVEIWQGDVNNYVLIDATGHAKCKGAYVKNLSPLDYDLPIVNKALVAYMTRGVAIEETILSCCNLIEFQKVFKVSDAFEFATHNGSKLSGKTFRVFASTRAGDACLYKHKKGVNYKFANCPEHCFIDNDNVTQKAIPAILDRQYYIDLAYHRLAKFGTNNHDLI